MFSLAGQNWNKSSFFYYGCLTKLSPGFVTRIDGTPAFIFLLYLFLFLWCRFCFLQKVAAFHTFLLWFLSVLVQGGGRDSDVLEYGTANAVSTCCHCLSSVFCLTPLAWLVCLTFDFCLHGSPEGRPLFLWVWVPGAAAVGLEGSELGGVDGADVGRCGDETGLDA